MIEKDGVITFETWEEWFYRTCEIRALARVKS